MKQPEQASANSLAAGQDSAAPGAGNKPAAVNSSPGISAATAATPDAGHAPVCRIIPCLDVHAGRVVKGVRFTDLADAGDPVEIARNYDLQGADELVFLDITATTEKRDMILPVIRAVAGQVSIPLTVGGGVRTLDDVRRLLDAGATRVSVSSAAVARPGLVSEIARSFGAASLILALDARQTNADAATPRWEVVTHGGRQGSGLDAVEWARRMAEAGAGQILLTSMDRDGTRSGFDIGLTRAVADAVAIPVIASGGAGTLEHLAEGVLQGHAGAVLAASIFHFGEFTIPQARAYLASRGIGSAAATGPAGVSSGKTGAADPAAAPGGAANKTRDTSHD